jgi:Na+/melibiose symporter-like transporter
MHLIDTTGSQWANINFVLLCLGLGGTVIFIIAVLITWLIEPRPLNQNSAFQFFLCFLFISIIAFLSLFLIPYSELSKNIRHRLDEFSNIWGAMILIGGTVYVIICLQKVRQFKREAQDNEH